MIGGGDNIPFVTLGLPCELFLSILEEFLGTFNELLIPAIEAVKAERDNKTSTAQGYADCSTETQTTVGCGASGAVLGTGGAVGVSSASGISSSTLRTLGWA